MLRARVRACRFGLLGNPLAAQTAAELPALKGKLESIEVFGRSLEGDLLGETTSPEVSIYLPPGYATDRGRRYPVNGPPTHPSRCSINTH